MTDSSQPCGSGDKPSTMEDRWSAQQALRAGAEGFRRAVGCLGETFRIPGHRGNQRGRDRRNFALAVTVLVAATWPGLKAHATPQFARTYNMSCTACHSIPPRLNIKGLSFKARGYRLSPDFGGQSEATLPLSVWLTGTSEEQASKDFSELFLSKVELISGGPIGEDLSYFVEWRAVSQQTRSDGSLRDRSGRFEDAYLTWQVDDRSSLTVGQYRALNQVDVSRRLSISEPAVFSTSLAGDPSSDPRIGSLRAFSPAGRSPGFTYELHSIQGEAPSDGLFHYVTVPFVGELSIPLTSEAKDEASFELEGPPKGVFLETFYRSGLNSIGAHAFIDDDRWLVTGAGVLNIADWLNGRGPPLSSGDQGVLPLYLTGALGIGDRDGGSSRVRSSLEVEYLFTKFDALRAGLGFRVEHVTNAGRDPAYIPYFVLSGPNQQHTFLLQVQYRAQEENDALLIGLSWLF